LTDAALTANRATPVFAGHGTEDDVVPLQLGRQAFTRLQTMNYPIEWHDYPMPHSVCIEEIADIGRWLTGRFTER